MTKLIYDNKQYLVIHNIPRNSVLEVQEHIKKGIGSTHSTALNLGKPEVCLRLNISETGYIAVVKCNYEFHTASSRNRYTVYFEYESSLVDEIIRGINSGNLYTYLNSLNEPYKRVDNYNVF